MLLWLFNIIVGSRPCHNKLPISTPPCLHRSVLLQKNSQTKHDHGKMVSHQNTIYISYHCQFHTLTGPRKTEKSTYIQLSILHLFPSWLGLQDLPVFRSKGISTSVVKDNQRQVVAIFFVVPRVCYTCDTSRLPQNNMVLYQCILDYTASFVSIHFEQEWIATSWDSSIL